MKLMNTDANRVHQTLSSFQFSAVDMDRLGASEYTIVQILVDASSSVQGFRKAMEQCMDTILESCRQSPRSENLLLRVAVFNTQFQDSVEEVHGFALLPGLAGASYKGSVQPAGATPLYDAALSAVESLAVFGQNLYDQDYLANAVCFIVTDGLENASRKADAGDVARAVQNVRRAEILESMQLILIGVNDADFGAELDDFRVQSGLDEYVSLGKVNAQKLAKLAQWVSRSIQATSQALGTGGPSRKIGFQF